ncbi:MAG: orotate phosphoribosyltransferase [Actinobacteria bacterium]|nr:MAG: orotate phosphoribosyltransferase [Actinomycetota bacterium]
MDREDLGRRIYETAHLTGRFLLRSGATSEEYFDKYLFESDPVLLRAIAEAMAPLVPPSTDALAGLELGGVPLATALSRETGLATRFVRKEAKAYGTCRLAEGGDVDGARLVVVEDVITSGGQVVMSCADLRERGAEVVRVLCVIDREAGGAAALEAAGLDLHALFTMTELVAAQPAAAQPAAAQPAAAQPAAAQPAATQPAATQPAGPSSR